MKKHLSTISPDCAVLLLAAAATVGCAGASDQNATADQEGSVETAPAGINGTLLHRATVGADHVVELYEFERGVTALREALHIDQWETARFMNRNAFGTLADVYLELHPDAAEIPSAIREADQRAAERQIARQTSTLKRGRDERELEPPSGAPVAQRALLSVAPACSTTDYYNDGWGADWFLQNFCGPDDWCPTNAGQINTGRYPRFRRWFQMEGDFNVAGHVTAWWWDWHWYGFDDREVLFEYDIAPRWVESWNFCCTDDDYEIRGESPCNRAHAARKPY